MKENTGILICGVLLAVGDDENGCPAIAVEVYKNGPPVQIPATREQCAKLSNLLYQRVAIEVRAWEKG